MLPVSESYMLGPEPPFYGWGSSNQTVKNSPQAANIGPGMIEPNLQADLYVPDFQQTIEDIEQEIEDISALIIPVTFNAFGSVPNAQGASVASNAITLQPADGTNPGGISTGTQTIAGSKTFSNAITTPSILLPTSASDDIGTIQINGTAALHTYGLNNTFTGNSSGNFALTGQGNQGYGNLSLNALTTGSFSTCHGSSSGRLLTTGQSNCFYGTASGFSAVDTIGDILIGANSGVNLVSGQEVVAIGNNSLPNATDISNAIEISNGTIGNLASNEIRIGMSSSNKCFLRGIASITPPGTPQMVIIDPATHQLGSQSIDNFLTQNYTMTLDSGTITTSTVRGASSAVLPISLTRVGKVVTMTIPNFQITAQSASASTVNLTGASSLPVLYRPSFACSFLVSVLDNAAFGTGIMYVTSGGLVTMQIGPAFTLPTGFSYDVSVSWIVI